MSAAVRVADFGPIAAGGGVLMRIVGQRADVDRVARAVVSRARLLPDHQELGGDGMTVVWTMTGTALDGLTPARLRAAVAGVPIAAPVAIDHVSGTEDSGVLSRASRTAGRVATAIGGAIDRAADAVGGVVRSVADSAESLAGEVGATIRLGAILYVIMIIGLAALALYALLRLAPVALPAATAIARAR